VGPRAGLDRCGKFAPPGFDPRTVQPVANLCTEYAVPAGAIKIDCIEMLQSQSLNADGEFIAGDEQEGQFDTRISVQVGTNVIVVLYSQSTNGTQE